MSFVTCSPDTVQYWQHQHVPTSLVARVDDVSYVTIEIPEEDPRLKHPDFFALAVKSKRFEKEALLRHIRPPIYTIKKGGAYSDTLSKDGVRAVPLTRQVGLLKHYLVDPKKKEPEFTVALLGDYPMLVNLLDKAAEAGVARVTYLATKKYTLDFHIAETLPLIQHR